MGLIVEIILWPKVPRLLEDHVGVVLDLVVIDVDALVKVLEIMVRD